MAAVGSELTIKRAACWMTDARPEPSVNSFAHSSASSGYLPSSIPKTRLQAEIHNTFSAQSGGLNSPCVHAVTKVSRAVSRSVFPSMICLAGAGALVLSPVRVREMFHEFAPADPVCSRYGRFLRRVLQRQRAASQKQRLARQRCGGPLRQSVAAVANRAAR